MRTRMYRPSVCAADALHLLDSREAAQGAQPLVGVKRRKIARTFRCHGGSASQSARYGACPRIEVRPLFQRDFDIRS